MDITRYVSKQYNTDRIKALNPTYIGAVAGINFYEHPIQGDEGLLLCEYNGCWYLSNFMELPEYDPRFDELLA